jgi:3',5'-cyclic AMP phosphodiesterase CpdA
MPAPLRIAITADLHWGHQGRGEAASRDLFALVNQEQPDVFVLAGDVGAGDHYAECLGEFSPLQGRKVVLPGNHDVWVSADAERDSLVRYEEDLPRLSAEHGFHYLDHGPLILPDSDLAFVGSMNWYDYTWSLDALTRQYPDELHRLRSKRFSRGRHNDANFVRWPLDDVTFTARAVGAFARHLTDALEQVSQVVAVTHHPPYHGLGFPHPDAPETLDSLLWDAFCGNRALEELLARHADRIAFAFCGHTHRQRESDWQGIRGFNVGGDYHFKRLLWLDWPARTVEAHQFGQEG